MSKEIYHECTSDIVCPHCGYKREVNPYLLDLDWGRDDKIEDHECRECGKTYDVKRGFIAHYSTKKIERKLK